MEIPHNSLIKPSPEKATFADNFQHVFRSFFSVNTYSGNACLNNLYTRLSVMWFVGLYWRPLTAIVIIASFVISIVSLFMEYFGPNQKPFVWLAFAFTMLSTLFIAIYRLSNLHNSRAFGGDNRKHKLDSKQLLDEERHVQLQKDEQHQQLPSLETFHLSRFVQRSDTTLIIKVKHFDNLKTANWVEFDTQISKHLLEGHIVCRKNERNKYFHFGTRAILDKRKNLRDTQVEVLNILRRNALKNGKSFFDKRKLSLGSIEFSNKELVCELGSTSYFCSMVTNDAAAKVIITENGKTIKEYDTTKLYPSIGQPGEKPSDTTYKLQTFGDTVGLSNHIGSVVVAVSSDGIPILCFQNEDAMVNAGASVLSGAGSLEFEDFEHSEADKTGFLDDAVRFGMARELLEETGGIPQDSYREFDRARLRKYAKRIKLAGFYRDLRRGAFPVFVGFCRMEASFAEIGDRSPSTIWGLKSPIETRVDTDLPREEISTVKEYQNYLRSYLKVTRDMDRKPSDQVLIIDALLNIDVVAKHFQRVLDQKN